VGIGQAPIRGWAAKGVAELAQLVRSGIAVDAVEGFMEVMGQGVGGGDDVVTGVDLDGAVAAGGADELADRPACPGVARWVQVP
jgi:hypothetical protein